MSTNTASDQIKHASAGGLAGALTRFLTQPFDVLKVRFQLQTEPISRMSERSKYRSVYHAFKLIYIEEGIIGLWKGHNPAQLLSVVYGISQFWTYEQLLLMCNNNELLKTKPNLCSFICGATAGITGTITATPFDVIRTRLIAQDHKTGYKSATQAAVSIVKNEGFFCLYRGLASALIQIAPQMGSNFMIYRFLTRSMADKFGLKYRNELPTWILLAIGATSGVLSKTLVYPFDLVKKRLQIQGFEQNRKTFGKHFTCNSMTSCFKFTIREEGIGGLFKGMTPTILKSGFQTAIYFSSYDKLLKFMNEYLI